MQLPITIGPHRSFFLRCGLLAGGLLSIAVPLLAPYSVAIQCSAIMLCWVGLIRSWRHCRPAVAAIRLGREGQLSVAVEPLGEFVAAELLPGAIVHPWLSVIRLQTEDGCRYTVVLAVDSLAAEDFRRLRVFLRWRASFSTPVDGA